MEVTEEIYFEGLSSWSINSQNTWVYKKRTKFYLLNNLIFFHTWKWLEPNRKHKKASTGKYFSVTDATLHAKERYFPKNVLSSLKRLAYTSFHNQWMQNLTLTWSKITSCYIQQLLQKKALVEYNKSVRREVKKRFYKLKLRSVW